MPRLLSTDRNSKFYLMHIEGRQLHIDLHPNKTSGGFFRIHSIEEGEALIARLREGLRELEADINRNANVPLSSDSEGEE